jgi:hypothetical protein
MDTIDKATYADLAGHFTTEQMIEIGFTVRLSNMINRFHADQEDSCLLRRGLAPVMGRRRPYLRGGCR